MSFIPRLYFSPGAISMVAHIALEEVSAPYRLEPVRIRDGQQLTERYRRIHPLGRVPALEIAEGVVLTETPALLNYIAESRPELELLPQDLLGKARANEWMSLFASEVHPSFISFFRPDRYTSNQVAQAALKADGRQRFTDMLRYMDNRLPDEGYLLGERYSLCDAYLAIFHLWAKRFELSTHSLVRSRRLVAAVLERPAVKRSLEQEGFGRSSPAGGASA